jgi:hypothetical protein
MLMIMAFAAITIEMVQTANVTTKSVPQRRNKTNFIHSDESLEHP